MFFDLDKGNINYIEFLLIFSFKNNKEDITPWRRLRKLSKICPFYGKGQNFRRTCAKPENNISKWNFGIRVLKQFGKTWHVSNFFSQKSLYPNLQYFGIVGLYFCHQANPPWLLINVLQNNPNQYCHGHIRPKLLQRFNWRCLVWQCWFTGALQ